MSQAARKSEMRGEAKIEAGVVSSPSWIADETVDQILSHDMALKAVSDALACHAANDYVQPLKPYVRPKGREMERESGRFIAMPAYVGGAVQAVGLKWIASVPANVDTGEFRARQGW